MKKSIGIGVLSMVLAAIGGASAEVRPLAEPAATAFRTSVEQEWYGQYEAARETLLEIGRTESYVVNLRLGWLSYALGKYSEAEAWYKKAEAAEPQALDAKHGLALALLAQGAWVKAEQKCNQILTKDFYNYYGNLYLISAYKGQKKFSEAEAIARKMTEVYPTDLTFLLELAYAQASQNKRDAARSVYEMVLMLSPGNVSATEGIKVL